MSTGPAQPDTPAIEAAAAGTRQIDAAPAGTSAPTAGKDAPSDSTAPPPGGDLDLLLRVAGGVVATLLGAVTGLFEAFYSPLYLAGWRLPAVIGLALIANPVLVWFAYVVTGRRIAAVGPAVAWMAVMVVAAGGTTEGDIVLAADNWVALVTMLVGSIAFALAGYRLVLAGGRPPR